MECGSPLPLFPPRTIRKRQRTAALQNLAEFEAFQGKSHCSPLITSMNPWTSHDFLDCLGWTLIHFLWQGLIIAAFAAAALRLLRRHSANVRYLAGCFALLLLAAAPVATFCSLNRPEEIPTLKFTVRTFEAPDTTVELPRPTAAPPKAALAIAPNPAAHKTTFPEFLEASLPWLVAAWSVGVLALSCRLFAGWLFIQKLRRSATLVDPLQARLKRLAAHIGVSRPIRLLQSACVEVPTVIGWLRPVILLPASCLAGLTPAQLESILAHELAHIRRHDYLINLLQNVVETLLFYHPAVWWISRRIRAEREHCCDDLAVKTCGDAAAYARALATLEELRPAPAPFALAASGAPLLDRIRRLAGQPERSAVRPAWPVAGVIALLLLALLAAALRNNPASAEPAAEGHRRDASHPTYAYDQSFFDYFGTNGVAAVETSRTNQIANPSALTNLFVAANNPATQPPIAPFPLATRATQTNQPSSTEEYNPSLGEQRALASKQSTIVTQLNPPSPAASIAGVDGPTIVVTVDKLGRYYYRNRIVSEGELKRDLEAEVKSSPQPMTLLLRVDEETESRVVVGMTELAKSKGIRNVLLQTLPRGETTAKPPQINLKTKWVEIDAATLGTNTFMSFFATNESQSPATVPATFDFTEYYSLQPTNLAEPSSNVFLHSAHGDAPLAAFLSDTQIAAAIKKLEQRDGVDILTGPEVTTESDRQCQIQAVDINTILLGGSPPGTTNGPRVLTNIPTGPIVDLVPRVSRGANKIDLKIVGTVTEFVGYENPATVTNQNGKPMPKNWAIPRFRVRQFSSTVTVTNAQTFVLGAAPVPMTTFQKSNSKVPVLGDIPLLGRLFRSTKTSTSTAQKSLVLLVTPTLVNPDGTRFVPPPEPKPDGQLKETGALEPRPDGFSRTNIVHTSKGRQAIMSKLDRIRLESVEYHTLPLNEVTKNLTSQAQRLDPEKTGINFFITRESPASAAPGTIDPATGLPATSLSAVPNVDIRNVNVTIDPALKNVRLMDLLDAITKCSDVPIKYSVLDYAIVFSLRNTNEGAPLEIRTFPVDPNKFRELLENLSNLPRGAFAATNLTNGFSYASSGHPDALQVSVRKFFSSVGADFDTNNPANVGKAFVWGDKRGILTVRATASDLDLIATALDTLLRQPPQIKLKTVIAEVIQDDNRALGFNWTLGNFNIGSNIFASGEYSARFKWRTKQCEPVRCLPRHPGTERRACQQLAIAQSAQRAHPWHNFRNPHRPSIPGRPASARPARRCDVFLLSRSHRGKRTRDAH